MQNYIHFSNQPEFNSISVIFNIENPKIMTIGEKMNQINELAYMNGYNWEIFLDFYLAKNHPEILQGLTPDPEAGTYVAFYDLLPENEAKAKHLVKIIDNLIENEQEILSIVSNHGNDIEWD